MSEDSENSSLIMQLSADVLAFSEQVFSIKALKWYFKRNCIPIKHNDLILQVCLNSIGMFGQFATN